MSTAVGASQNNLGCLPEAHAAVEQALIDLVDFKTKENFSQTWLYYHPFKISTSWHNSGTEAVEAACRLARFNTGRKYVVTFDTTYQGWTDSLINGISVHGSRDGQICLPAFHPRSLEVHTTSLPPV